MSDDPLERRRRQRKARFRRNLTIAIMGGVFVFMGLVVVVVLLLRSHGGVPGFKESMVTGTVDLVSMDMMAFLDEGEGKPSESKPVIVVKRRGRPDAYCYFPPKSGGAWLGKLNRGDEVWIAGKLESESPSHSTYSNCRMVR